VEDQAGLKAGNTVKIGQRLATIVH